MNWRLLTRYLAIGSLLAGGIALHGYCKSNAQVPFRQESGIEDFYLPIHQESRHFSVYTPTHSQQTKQP